jgi:O-antigen ligase
MSLTLLAVVAYNDGMTVPSLFVSANPLRRAFESFAMGLALLIPLFLVIGRGLADGAMGMVSLIFLAFCIIDKKWQWAKTPWFLLSLVATLYMMSAGVFAEFSQRNAMIGAIAWLRFPLFIAAFSFWLLPHERVRTYLVPILILTLVCVSIDTLWQFVFDTSLSGNPKPVQYQIGRLTGPFSKMVVGLFLLRFSWPAIGYFFGWALQENTKKRLAYPILFVALLAVTILISGERVAFGLFGICCLLFFIGAKQIRLPLLGVGVLGAVVLVAMIAFVPILKERFIKETSSDVSNIAESAYGSVWKNGMAAWKYSPIKGIGLNNFVPMCEQLGKSGGFINEPGRGEEIKCVRHPHNFYLEWLAETGIIGLILFVSMVILWLRQAWRQLRVPNLSLPDYYGRLGCFLGLIPLLWPLMSTMSFFSNWNAVTFWWVLALALRPDVVEQA